MYSIISLVVLLSICFAVETTLAAENGYIASELPEIPCKDPSSAISTCSESLHYKIADFSNYPNPPDLSEIRRNIPLAVVGFGLYGERCRKAATKYLCQVAYPFRCEAADAYVQIDLNEIKASCDGGRQDCSSLNATARESVFNCSSLANDPGLHMKIPRKMSCHVFPVLKNDPYSCEANYKVYGGNVTELKLVADRIAFFHKMLKNANISDAECEKNVADAMCKAPIPACSKDQTKVVFLHSKQGCRKIMGCVNKTNNDNLIQTSHALCNYLPDGTTAKKYSLDNVYDNKATSHVMTFSTILFIATLVGQSFF